MTTVPPKMSFDHPLDIPASQGSGLSPPPYTESDGGIPPTSAISKTVKAANGTKVSKSMGKKENGSKKDTTEETETKKPKKVITPTKKQSTTGSSGRATSKRERAAPQAASQVVGEDSPVISQTSGVISIDVGRVGKDMAKSTKSFLSGALYKTTGLSTRDLSNFRDRMMIAFSGVPLGSIGINAKELEAVLAGQPGANYQGVINALVIQQQALQTGKPVKNVNYDNLIAQVQKMQNSANDKMQQTNGVQVGRVGMGQASLTEQNAKLQQQLML